MNQSPIDELIEDPNTVGTNALFFLFLFNVLILYLQGEMMEKYVFVIFYQGSRAQEKIKRICESFSANLYPCPDSAHERAELLRQVETRLEDLDVVLQRRCLSSSFIPPPPNPKTKETRVDCFFFLFLVLTRGGGCCPLLRPRWRAGKWKCWRFVEAERSSLFVFLTVFSLYQQNRKRQFTMWWTCAIMMLAESVW